MTKRGFCEKCACYWEGAVHECIVGTPAFSWIEHTVSVLAEIQDKQMEYLKANIRHEALEIRIRSDVLGQVVSEIGPMFPSSVPRLLGMRIIEDENVDRFEITDNGGNR